MHVVSVIDTSRDFPSIVATYGLFRNTHACEQWLFPDGREGEPNRKVKGYIEQGFVVTVTPIEAPGTNKPLLRPLR